MKYKDGNYCGTAVLLHDPSYTGEDGEKIADRHFLLSCGHNYVHIVKKDNHPTHSDYPISSVFRFGEERKWKYFILSNVHLVQSNVSSVRFYPDFDGEFLDGRDLAIGLLDGDYRNCKAATGCFLHCVDYAKVGDTITVVGYPEEYSGDVYKMQGTITMIESPNPESPHLKLIYYDNINTTPGQSGSPVFLHKDNKYYIIGIHVGYDNYHKMNVATGITKEIFTWIVETYKLMVASSNK
jgi:hypothetical protein